MKNIEVTKDKNLSIIKAIEKQMPILREHLTGLAAKLKEIIDKSQLDEFIDSELLDEGVELIRAHVQKQEDILSKIKQLFPECKEKSFSSIEQLLLDKKIYLEICDTAINALMQFQLVDVNHEAARKVLIGCKEKALQLAEMPEATELKSIAEPYRLFLEIMDNPRMDITAAQEVAIDDEFPKPLPRLLYNGQFFLKDNIPSGKEAVEPVNEVLPQTEQRSGKSAATKKMLPPESTNYTFLTKKESTKFKATSFLSDIGKKNGQNSWTFYLPFGEEKRDLLLILGWCRLLSEGHISRYVLSDVSNISTVLQPLVNEGYLTEITYHGDGSRYYCFSPMGIQMFKKASSREVFSADYRIPDLLTTSEFFKAHQNIIPILDRLNRCTLFLYHKYIPELSDEKGINIEITLISRETAKYNIPYSELSISVPSINEKRSYVLVGAMPKNTSEAEDLKTAFGDTDFDAYIYISDETIDCLIGGSNGISLIYNPRAYLATFEQEKEVLNIFDLEGNCHTASLLTDELMRILEESANDAADDDICLKPSEEENPEKDTQQESTPLPESPESPDSEPEFPEQLKNEKENETDTGNSSIVAPDTVQEFHSEPKTAREMAAQFLRKGVNPSNTSGFTELLDMLLAEGIDIKEDDIVENSFAQALLLSKALSFESEYPEYAEYFNRLLLATDSTISEHSYSGNNILMAFEESDEFSAMHLAAMLRALFAPDIPYDYNLRTHAETLFKDYDMYFRDFPMVKQLYNLLLQINDQSASGFSNAVLKQFSDHETKNGYYKQLQITAQRLCDEPVIKAKMSGMPEMKTACFGPRSDFGFCMGIISNNNLIEREIVQITYEKFCESVQDGRQLSPSKIDAVIDNNWRNATRGCKTYGLPLQMIARKQIFNNYQSRLELMGKWLAATETKSEKASVGLLDLRKSILQEMDIALQELSAVSELRDRTILGCMIKRLKNKLEGLLPEDRFEFADLLRTGVFSLDERGLPVLDEQFRKVRFYEPWRNALRHISAPVIGLRKMLVQISDDRCHDCFDNLGTAIMICNYFELLRLDGCSNSQYAQDFKQGKKSAEACKNTFRNELELAFAYGRIQEETKEDVWEDILAFQDGFFDLHDFGCWRSFLQAMRQRIDVETAAREKELQAEIQERSAGAEDEKLSKLLSKAHEKLRERNFVVAEEYINRYDSGKSGDLGQAYIEEPDGSAFNRFISIDNFDRLYALCRRNKERAIKNFGIDYIKNNLKMSKKYQDSSERLVRNWPNWPGEANIDRIKILFQELGFTVEKVQKVTAENSYNHYAVHVKADQKDKAEYNHPIALFGTQVKTPIDVVCLYGLFQANDLVDKVCGLELNNTAIVLINGYLDLSQRRQMAERFHSQKSGENPFLMIDWSLLLYLAMHQHTERLPVLLNCTLPYTSSYQPFVLSGSTPDEMFIGRKRELNSITDPNGAVIVYGGRQLGKTALLERARSLKHHPERKEYAVYVNADDCDCEAKLANKICDELAKSEVRVTRVDSLEKICSKLELMFRKDEITALLLLIDESDKFLGDFKDDEYNALRPLVSLRRATTNRFKFVLAGLHNVCRAKEAFGPNSVFGQMGEPLCIRPLSSTDALQLLTRPLRYLGFDVDDRLESILALANYYPGILHFVGYKLVENLTGRYMDYYRAANGNPPFGLQDDQLGSIMNSADLNNSINEKIRLTLRIDPRYFMLARCIAWYYYEEPELNRQGYSVDDIKTAAGCLDIKCLKDEGQDKYEELLQELVDMGILTKPSSVTFRLRQRKFLDAIGNTQAAIEKDIANDNLCKGANAHD